MPHSALELGEPYRSTLFCKKRFLFLYGGAGSGKSQCAARKILWRMIEEKGHRFLIVRKTKCRIRDSMFTLLKDIIEEYGISDFFIFKEEEMKIIYKDNKNEIISVGLKDSEKIKSITGITGIWVEEAFELEKKDFDQLNLRLRGNTPHYKQIICTFNPMDANHWLKTFMDRQPDNLFAMQTTFHDNIFIDKEYMDELLNQYKQNENFTRVYIKGEWGRAYTGGEFYHGFSYSNHVAPFISHAFEAPLGVGVDTPKGALNSGVPAPSHAFKAPLGVGVDTPKGVGVDTPKGVGVDTPKGVGVVGVTEGYNPNLPLHITFDFNVNPYLTCCVWQLHSNDKGELKKAMQIDEICLAHPVNSTKNVCAEFKRRYFHEKGHRAGLFVYGDPSGKHEDTRSEKGYNDFTIIKNELQDMRPTMRVETKAPNVKSRGDFINSVLSSEYQNISILISDNCRKSIDDFSYLKQDANGDKLKEKAKDEKTGITFERYGHTSDSADYFLTTVFASEFNYFTNGRTHFEPIYKKRINNNWW